MAGDLDWKSAILMVFQQLTSKPYQNYDRRGGRCEIEAAIVEVEGNLRPSWSVEAAVDGRESVLWCYLLSHLKMAACPVTCRLVAGWLLSCRL